MSTQDCCDTLYGFRFEYIFRLNIQSVKECDPTKLSQEMGPHYVSCILSYIIMVVKLYLSLSTTVEMCKESVDIECHIFACTSLGACEWWVLCASLMDRSQVHWIGGWVNAKEVLVVQEKGLTPAWKQILFFLHINSYFGGYGRWWISVMDIKDKIHFMQSSNQWKLTFELSVIER
jgi:hypothetical protein